MRLVYSIIMPWLEKLHGDIFDGIAARSDEDKSALFKGRGPPKGGGGLVLWQAGLPETGGHSTMMRMVPTLGPREDTRHIDIFRGHLQGILKKCELVCCHPSVSFADSSPRGEPLGVTYA